MSHEINNATTKDWLGDGMITPFPIPSGAESLSSSDVEDRDASESDTGEVSEETSDTEQPEAQPVG